MDHSLHQSLSRTLLVVVFSLLGAGPLAAGESPWYVNTKLGQGSLSADFGRPFPIHFEGHDETGDVEFGYLLHRHLAVQAGYHDLGEYQGFGGGCVDPEVLCIARAPLCVEGATDPFCLGLAIGPMTADASGVSLSFLPRWPLFDDRLTVFGKLGVIDWDVDVTGSFGVTLSERFSDRDLLSGLGVQYFFRKGLGVLVEYQRLNFGHDSTSVGASWRF